MTEPSRIVVKVEPPKGDVSFAHAFARVTDTPGTTPASEEKVSSIDQGRLVIYHPEPELIIYSARNGWVLRYRSETSPDYWPIWVVEDDDMKLIDEVVDVLGLSMSGDRRDESNVTRDSCDTATDDRRSSDIRGQDVPISGPITPTGADFADRLAEALDHTLDCVRLDHYCEDCCAARITLAAYEEARK